MSQKRHDRDEGTSFDDKRPRKSPSFKSVVLEVMKLCKLQKLVEPVLEPLIRRVVKEEVDIALRKYLISMRRNSHNIHPSESRSLHLQFSNPISLPVFTGTRIEGEGCANFEISLVDTTTKQVISSGPESSAKAEILVLEGDFDSDDGNNWTFDEFANNIVKERERKKPLLSGEINVTLENGTGSLGDVWFTDNSSWTRSRKFRLGARLVDNFDGVRVREAKSEPFVVRDHRGELYKKHHPPSLVDEVWRLEKIGKGGAFHKRLSNESVQTVQDFLIMFFSDPTKLRNILGTGVSGKMWEVVVEHARTCVFDDKLYLYDNNMSKSLQKDGVVFNPVGQVMGMFSNGQYLITDKLSETEKTVARELVISAFNDRENIVSFDEESSPNTPTIQYSSNLSTTYLQDSNTHKIGKFPASPDFMQPVYSTIESSSFDDYLDPLETRFSFRHEVSDNLICDTDSMTRAFCENEYFGENSSNLDSLPSECQNDKSRKAWNILVSVLRWWFSIKRIVARKTRHPDSGNKR